MMHQEDNLQVCPYNPSHLIRRKRMITHLTKCRKQYISLGYQICPMDATHHVPSEEFENHLETCPSRGVVDVAMYDQGTNPPANPILPREKLQAILVPTDENWDDECVPTYDPNASAANKNIIRILKNAPPAEKKAFVHAERLRLLEIQDREAAQGPLRNVGRETSTDTIRMPAQPSQAFVHAERQNRTPRH